MSEPIPTRFEQLYPREVKFLMKLYRQGKRVRIHVTAKGEVI